MREILRKSFEKHFPAWEGLSPSDPIRLFADSLQDSLVAIEARQKQMVGSLIDSLPSLVGIEAQSAQLPAGWVALEPSAKLKTSAVLPAGTALKFVAENGDVHLVLSEDTRVEPISHFEAHVEQNRVRLSFQCADAVERLRVAFRPTVEGQRAHLKSHSAPLIADTTDAMSRAGTLTFRLPPNTHSIDLEFNRPVLGIFLVNVAWAELQKREGETRLGILAGEPWESIHLPEAFARPPERIVLRFPDEQTRELHRGAEELLRRRDADPEAFEGLFFYNGLHHSLVLPGAEKWMRGYSGGARVETYSGVVHSGMDWVPKDAVFANEFPRMLNAARPVAALRGYLPRETASDYLRRFYATVRSITQTKAPIEFRPAELCDRLPGVCPNVRTAEYALSDTGVIFYLLLEINQRGSGDEEQRILETAHEWLRAEVPLAYAVCVRRFKRTPLMAIASGAVSVPDLEKAVQPAPFGRATVGNAISARACGLAHWRVGAEGIFASELRRTAGECFDLQVAGGRNG